MRARRVVAVAGWLLLVTTYAGLTPVVAGRIPGQVLALALAGTALALALLVPRPKSGKSERGRGGERLTAGAAGALALFAAPYTVLTHRYTDAPPGTELLFFGTACWGAIAAVTYAFMRWRGGERRRAAAVLAGAFACLVGCAGVLGNWERPSSFSPLIRYGAEEAWILLAGVEFVVGVLLMRSALRADRRGSLVIAAGTATVLAVAASFVSAASIGSLGILGESVAVVALWALCGAGVWRFWADEAARGDLALPATLTLGCPALLTLLIMVEKLVGVSGPEPIVWGGVLGGSLLVAAGVARLSSSRGPAAPDGPRRGLATRYLRIGLCAVAAVSALLAVVGLIQPALLAEVSGVRDGGDLAISWAMAGWESVAGWAALALAALSAAAVLDDAVPALVTGLAASPAYWLLVRTPTHVLNSWLSPDIQSEYGTEYAAITFQAVPSWTARLAVAGAAIGLAIVLTRRLLNGSHEGARPAPGTLRRHEDR